MFNVVLVEPEIPANTGNIGRTCVITGSRLHLVRPLGFSLSSSARKRAGLLYWDHVDLRIHDSWSCFLNSEFASDHITPDISRVLHFATKKARKTYAQAQYVDGDYLVFGKESIGLPESLLRSVPECCERIPMLNDASCGFSECFPGVAEMPDVAGRAGVICATENACALEATGVAETTVTTQANIAPTTDICGNFVNAQDYSVNALNLSNSVAIMLYEALRQTGFNNMEA